MPATDYARTTNTDTFALIITAHETSQNYLDFTDIPNTDIDQLKNYMQTKYPGGTWISDSLYNTELNFFTILSGFGPSTITATDHYHYYFYPKK